MSAPLLPARFLLRCVHPCRFDASIPGDDDSLLDLSAAHRLEHFAAMDGGPSFADVRIAWNENGIGIQYVVKGKEKAPVGNVDRPRASDGLTIWLDTRGDRTSHRASRHCHQFHVLPAAAGPELDQPVVTQSKINRALQDAPIAPSGSIPFRFERVKSGYRMEAFFPSAVLNGFDPEEHPRLGIFTSIRDQELGEQTLGVGPEFPFADDPSLWDWLDLVRAS